MRALVTGATGFVGRRLAERLVSAGHEVRCLVRDRRRARGLEALGCEVREGNVLQPWSLQGAGTGVDVAYYLVHSMGRGRNGDYRTKDREGASAFAQMARRERIERVVYLGGLGDDPQSEHLRSRHETAQTLSREGPPLTYLRAAMVVGAGSESYRTLRYLVERLPAMIAPAWLSTETQPIAVDDVLSYMEQVPHVPESAAREVQLGGPDVLTYADMLDRMADVLGRSHRPKLPVPLVSPWLSSLWIGLITPVDAGVARPLIEGLSTRTVVSDPSGAALFDVSPMSVDEALRRAHEEEAAETRAA